MYSEQVRDYIVYIKIHAIAQNTFEYFLDAARDFR